MKKKFNKKTDIDIHQAAAILGKEGGLKKSPKKTKSCRENGKKGGWPKGRSRKKDPLE